MAEPSEAVVGGERNSGRSRYGAVRRTERHRDTVVGADRERGKEASDKVVAAELRTDRE